MSYEFYFAPLELNGDIRCTYHDDLITLTSEILSDSETKCIYLCAINSQIFISEYIAEICHWITDFTKRHNKNYNEENFYIHFQQYNSFEEAYKIALEMNEENPLCYEQK